MKLNFVVISDLHTIKGAVTLFFSIKRVYPTFNFYLILTEDAFLIYKDRCKKAGIITIVLDNKILNKYQNVDRRITNATFGRLYILDLIPKLMKEKFIYLDVDILVVKKIPEKFYGNENIAFLEAPLNYEGAHKERDINWWEKRIGHDKKVSKSIGQKMRKNEYFNAGVMIINNPAKFSDLTKKIRTSKKKHDDQTLLNFYNRDHFIVKKSKTINAFPYLGIKSNTRVIHFVGATKPWDEQKSENIVNLLKKYKYNELLEGYAEFVKEFKKVAVIIHHFSGDKQKDDNSIYGINITFRAHRNSNKENKNWKYLLFCNINSINQKLIRRIDANIDVIDITDYQNEKEKKHKVFKLVSGAQSGIFTSFYISSLYSKIYDEVLVLENDLIIKRKFVTKDGINVFEHHPYRKNDMDKIPTTVYDFVKKKISKTPHISTYTVFSIKNANGIKFFNAFFKWVDFFEDNQLIDFSRAESSWIYFGLLCEMASLDTGIDVHFSNQLLPWKSFGKNKYFEKNLHRNNIFFFKEIIFELTGNKMINDFAKMMNNKDIQLEEVKTSRDNIINFYKTYSKSSYELKKLKKMEEICKKELKSLEIKIIRNKDKL